MGAAEGMAQLAQIYPGAPFANGFYHGAAGMERVSAGLDELRSVNVAS